MQADLEALLEHSGGERPDGIESSRTDEFRKLREDMESKEPPWSDMETRCLELLGRGRDLFVMTLLCRVLVRTEGLRGLADSLEFIARALESSWGSLWPTLRVDEAEPAVRRASAFATLTGGPMLRDVRDIQLLRASHLGKVTVRDLEAAPLEPPNPAGELEQKCAMADSGSEVLAALRQAGDATTRIENAFENRGMGKVDLRLLKDLLAVAGARLARRLPAAEPAAASEANTKAEFQAETVSREPQAGGEVTKGRLQSRREVVATLDLVLDYYRRWEPASPVPLLISRAKRLVDKDFMAAVQELAPNGLEQLRALAGTKEGG